MRIGVLPVARPTFDVPFAETTLNQALLSLGTLDHDLTGTRQLQFSHQDAEHVIDALASEPPDLILVMQVTFADAGMIKSLADRIERPILLWGFPEARWGGRPRLNALCGINLSAHALRRQNHPYRCLYANASDAGSLTSALETTFHEGGSTLPSPRSIDDGSTLDDAAAARTLEAIARSRIGLVGDHPDGFETCRFDEGDLAQRFGIAVEQIDLKSFFNRADSIPEEQLEPVAARATDELTGLDAVDADATHKSYRLYAALRGLAAEKRLAGFAVRCWPEMFTDYGCAVCGALGMLNEDAIPCACEADMVGNVTNLLLQALAGEPPWIVDLVHADANDNSAVIWHCGLAPRSMASAITPPRADIHANRKLPLLQAFALKAGRMTIARLSQFNNRLALVIAGADMIEAPMSFCGTSGVLRFDRPVMDVLDDLLALGLEHHFSIVYGDYRPALRSLAAHLDIPLYDLTA